MTQLRWPALGGAKNEVRCSRPQRISRIGAIEERFVGDVRPATTEEPLDPSWRPIQESDSFEGPDDSAPWPEDPTALYYWRPTFWRASTNSGSVSRARARVRSGVIALNPRSRRSILRINNCASVFLRSLLRRGDRDAALAVEIVAPGLNEHRDGRGTRLGLQLGQYVAPIRVEANVEHDQIRLGLERHGEHGDAFPHFWIS